MKIREIEVLWQKYEGLLQKINNENIDKMLDTFGERILVSSFSQRTSEPFCGIGGNVEYALELAKVSNNIAKALNYDIDKFSIIKCTLLSILGRVGTLTQNRYVECKSDWHKDKLGQYYDWNERCPKYQVNDMTLYILQTFNIALTWDEWQAISLVKSMSSEDNNFYNLHKSRLSLVMQLAHEAVMKDEKDKIDGVYTTPF
ncbi:MAG: hypothetical protein EBY39_11640 [Flavobacteriia bacterium]|nr:hypothetical protein [Flavobacteriia bacterium]